MSDEVKRLPLTLREAAAAINARDALTEPELRRVLMYATVPAGAIDLLDRLAEAIEAIAITPHGARLAHDLREAADRYSAAIEPEELP